MQERNVISIRKGEVRIGSFGGFKAVLSKAQSVFPSNRFIALILAFERLFFIRAIMSCSKSVLFIRRVASLCFGQTETTCHHFRTAGKVHPVGLYSNCNECT